MLDMWADISNAQYCWHNELGNMLLMAHIITGEYVMRYITLLFQKVILLCTMLLGVNLIVNSMLFRYITHYISNALLLTVK